MTDYNRKLHAALEQLAACVSFIQAHLVLDLRVPEIPPFPDSGPSSADAPDDGLPPAAVAASPAGATLLDEAELAHVWAISNSARLQHFEARPLQKLLRAYQALASGTPGTAAAKESTDTTAAAPVGAALHDAESHPCNPEPERCSCEEALALRERVALLESRLQILVDDFAAIETRAALARSMAKAAL